MRAKSFAAAAVISVIVTGLIATTAAASGSASQPVLIQDRCDPVTFNQAGISCAPQRRGTVTLQNLTDGIAKDPGHVLADRDASGWRFQPDEFSVTRGTRLAVKNEGGEFHTFTNVTSTGFTGGCVAEINALFPGLTPNPQCANPDLFATTGVAPGGTLDVPMNATGTYPFQCMIHPWMRTTVVVRNN
jgi:plastocyanin